MALFKRNGIYYYEDAVTKRISLRTKNKKVAQALERDLQEKYLRFKMGLITRSELKRKPSEATIQHIYNEYVLAVLKAKANTSYYTSKLLPFVEAYGFKDINEFTYQDACTYKSHLLEDKTTKTARNHLAEIKQMFKWACLTKVASENVFDVHGFLPSKTATKPRYPVRIEWIKEAIQLAPSRQDEVYWTILLLTGLRANDAGNLQPEQINNGMIHQQKNKQYRPIVMTPTLKHYQKTGELFNACPTKQNQRTSRERLQAIFKERFNYVDADGKPHMDLHKIRHTHMTYLNQQGMDERQVGLLMGSKVSHVDYIQVDTKKAEAIIGKLDALA